MNLLANYTKIYFRRFRKESVHFTVNILGLSIGFAILYFIAMFVYDEYSVDSYHSKADRIYRVVSQVKEEDGQHEYLSLPGPMADALKADFPAIEEAAHLTYFGSQVLTVGESRQADRLWAIAEREIFDILDFEILAGNPKKDFAGPAGLVVTHDLAQRLFARTDVVGEVVETSRFGNIEVLAVMQEMPQNSTYKFSNIYVPNYDQWSRGFIQFISSWEERFAHTYVLFREGADQSEVMESKDAFLSKYLDPEVKDKYDFYFQNMLDIHLGSTSIERGGMGPRVWLPYSNREFLSMTLMLGLLVIFIATLNYVNLSSVQALKRTLEASMRKINGASNKQLVGQLFFETLLTVLIAYTVSLALIFVFFPYFQEIAGKSFSMDLLVSRDFVIYQVLSICIIWIVSALLPALYYSKLKRSLLILKNAFSGKGDLLRKIVVGIQYALSLFLIIGSIIIYRQLNFVQNKDLGFDNEQVMILDINSRAARENFRNIIAGIKADADVINVSTSSRVPGEWKNIPTVQVSENLTDGALDMSMYGIDHNFLDTYDIKLLEGKNFSGVDHTDSLYVLLNQTAVEVLELSNPIGASLWVHQSDTAFLKVQGVVEDFHFESLYEPIGPAILMSWNNQVLPIDYFSIRYTNNPRRVVDMVEAVNAKFDPNTPAEINFLDEQWGRFYKAEESRSTIMLIASIVSILISAFGLFGLINFTAERKTKEIGVRKVMGASTTNIVKLIMKHYVILLLIALVVASPIAYFLFQGWLDDFAFRIQMSADVFLIAFIMVSIISFSTVLARILRIARANPVNSIKYE